MKVDEIVNVLRSACKTNNGAFATIAKYTLRQAADAIEALTAENAEMRDKEETVYEQIVGGLKQVVTFEELRKTIRDLQAELTALREDNEWLKESSEMITAKAREVANENKDLRNELCLKCGRYKEAHNGACDGCRWRNKK